jgi:hypothetical protein
MGREGSRQGQAEFSKAELCAPGHTAFDTFHLQLFNATGPAAGPLLLWVKSGHGWVRVPSYDCGRWPRAMLRLATLAQICLLSVAAFESAGPSRWAWGALLVALAAVELGHQLDRKGEARHQRVPTRQASALALISLAGSAASLQHHAWTQAAVFDALACLQAALFFAFRRRRDREVLHVWFDAAAGEEGAVTSASQIVDLIARIHGGSVKPGDPG